MSNYDDMKEVTPPITKRTIILHHSADFDGIFCREVAKHFLPGAEVIGWDFADKSLQNIKADTLYVLDLPLDRPFGVAFDPAMPFMVCDPEEYKYRIGTSQFKNIIWIDHHKTSIDTHPTMIDGYRIDGVAACRLAWQWFTFCEELKKAGNEGVMPTWDELPTLMDFCDRRVVEPLAIRLAGEYDIWDHRDPRALIFQFGLRSRELDVNDWDNMLGNLTENSITVDGLLAAGKPLYDYQKSTDESTMRRSFIAPFEGLNLLCLNTARCNSLTFRSMDVPETGHDALCGFYWNGRAWTVSLYHASHRKDLDLSEIARKHGGGGHRGACGFITKTMPFQPVVV